MANGALGPAPINSPIRGLLDFFGIKNGGENPRNLINMISPTMDLTRWYQEAQADVFTFSRPAFYVANSGADGRIPITSTTPTDITNGAQLVVPQNEVWIALPGSRVIASFNAFAGQEIEVGMVMQASATDQFEWWPMNPREGYSTSSAAIIRLQARTLSDPIWIRPGSTITAFCYGATVPAGGSIDIAGTLKLVRLLS